MDDFPLETGNATSAPLKTYEFRLRLLGNEIIAFGFSTTNDSNRWLVGGLLTVFCVLTVVGAYSEKFVAIVKSLAM